MALSNLFSWRKNAEDVPETACGASDKPAACGADDKPEGQSTACGSACGAGDKA